MRGGKIEVKMKTGQTIQVLPGEVAGLKEAGLLLEENSDKLIERNEPERKDSPEEETREPEQKKKPGYKLPVLTKGEYKARIKQARRLKRKGFSQREIGRQLGVSHVAVGKWLKKEKLKW